MWAENTETNSACNLLPASIRKQYEQNDRGFAWEEKMPIPRYPHNEIMVLVW